jgi:LysM repeat protein
MKWKDSNRTVELNAESDESFYDTRNFSLKKENVPDEFSFLQKFKSPVILAGVGLFVLIVLIVVFYAGSTKTVEIPQVKAFETRIRALEKRFINIEKSIESAKDPGDRGKLFGQLNKRVDRLEAAMAQQMNKLLKQLDELKQQKVSTVSPVKVPVPEQTEVMGQRSEVTYHVVRKGENLYRISLRYGLKIDELLRLNKLDPGAVIQTGQKLVVSPKKGG